MDDPLKRLLEAEARAQSIIDAASMERQRILDEALAAAEAAVALTPRSPVAQFALAAAHLARGESGLAEAAFARAAECDQSLVVARRRLETGLASLRPR
jgi:tetratricopeptide (TPR) repeat protein